MVYRKVIGFQVLTCILQPYQNCLLVPGRFVCFCFVVRSFDFLHDDQIICKLDSFGFSFQICISFNFLFISQYFTLYLQYDVETGEKREHRCLAHSLIRKSFEFLTIPYNISYRYFVDFLYQLGKELSNVEPACIPDMSPTWSWCIVFFTHWIFFVHCSICLIFY